MKKKSALVSESGREEDSQFLGAVAIGILEPRAQHYGVNYVLAHWQ